MAFQHYLQLVRHYRKLLLLILAGSAAIAAVMSLYWLISSPVYTATTKVVMLPSDGELAFTDVWLRGSDMSPANIMTETHIEYLVSRPVIELTLDKISVDADVETEGFVTWLKQLPLNIKEFLRSIYHYVNYGEYVPLTPRQVAIDQLHRGIDVRAVEGSYLLEISVSHKDRDTAAIAANSLAEAYIEHAAAQAKESGDKLRAFLEVQIEQREQEIGGLIDHEYTLREEKGIITLEEARSMLMSMQESQRGKELDNQARLTELQVKLKALKGTKRGKSQSIQAIIEEEITLGEAEKKAIASSQPLRLQFIDDIVKEVNALGVKERPLVVLQRQRDRLEADITDLQKRLVVADMAASNAISKMRIVEPAVPSRYPESPKVVTNTAMGLIVGVLVALFVLIALDTFSSKVITSADLRRLTGERFIGRLKLREPASSKVEAPAQSLSAAAVQDSTISNEDLPAQKGARKWLYTLIDSLSSDSQRNLVDATSLAMERQLTILGAFDTKSLLITGFCNQSKLQRAAERMEMTLQGSGIQLIDTPPNGDNSAANDKAGQADKYVPLRPSIQVIKPVSASLRWQALASRKATLVCVIPAGEINEQTLSEFQSKAINSEVSTLAFVLLEA